MRVSQLIDALQKYNKELPVFVKTMEDTPDESLIEILEVKLDNAHVSLSINEDI